MRPTAPPQPQEISDDLGQHDEVRIGPAQVRVPIQEPQEYVRISQISHQLTRNEIRAKLVKSTSLQSIVVSIWSNTSW